MKNKIIDIAIIALLFVTTSLPQYQITNSVIGSGGNVVSNSNNNIVSTVGESFIGKSSNTINQNQIGFWFAYQQIIITEVENEETIPIVFKLEQNYPNPFNPSTKIKFAVPEKSNVLIKVYDILGSEVATLVNEEMDAGWYENNFNAAGLSSGVYLFRMEAGNYVNTKKMILLR
ncbi:MAG: T9SS type A sorting domain-containing protein [Ignavibacteriaceae bacterium]